MGCRPNMIEFSFYHQGEGEGDTKITIHPDERGGPFISVNFPEGSRGIVTLPQLLDLARQNEEKPLEDTTDPPSASEEVEKLHKDAEGVEEP